MVVPRIDVVLVPKDFDLGGIDKCFADDKAQFIEIEDVDSEIKTRRDGTNFIVLDKDYFTAYTQRYKDAIKCGYQSRNLVMSGDFNFWRQYYSSQENGIVLSVIKVNDLFIWYQPPFVYFVNKKDFGKITGYGTEDNSVVEYFDEPNIGEFAATVKSKINVVQHVFVVYLGNDMYQCFNTNDITMNYKYREKLIHNIGHMVRSDVNSIKELIEKDEKRKTPKIARNHNFKLLDMNGHEADESKKYFLKIRQEDVSDESASDEWVSDEHDALNYFDGQLDGCCSSGDLEVNCEIVDGITYILYEDHYLYAPEESDMGLIGGSSEVPEKTERLQFHLLPNNTFTITRWNDDIYASIEWVKSSYGALSFDDRDVNPPTEFYLEEKVQPSS